MKYSNLTIQTLLNLKQVSDEIHRNNVAKGFWEDDRSTGECIALMHSELSEALEADRKDLTDDHLPEFKGLVVELADAVIRIFDFCGRHGLPIGQAIAAKLAYNQSRPYKHGKKY